MRGFEHRIAVPDVCSGGDAESAHLSSAGVGNVVAVQVGGCEHGILVGTRDHLLEDGIGNTVIDH